MNTVKAKLLYCRIKLRLLLESETSSIEKVAIETRAVKIPDLQYGQMHLSILDKYTLQFGLIYGCYVKQKVAIET